jgi:MFS family permease
MPTNRWSVLALLFTVRTAMGFQFQAVPALSPMFMSGFGVNVADVGLLIGLYYAPGVALALPGGAIGRRFGDKTVAVFGLLLMCAGGLIMASLSSWELQLAGRLIAGIGGILMNVLMSKMVTDWFAGKEIATAMGIFVNSWPVGIALSLLAAPWLATIGGLQVALLGVCAYVAAGCLALALLYRAPPDASAAGTGKIAAPVGPALFAILAAGLLWGLYNAGLGMIFGFGPLMLTERGWTVAAASSATSVVLWLVAVSVPLGGLIADWTKRGTAVLVSGLVAFAILLVIAARVEAVLPAFIVLGLVSGLAAGPIMALPSRVLTPDVRAVGMGLFFTMFYAVQLTMPWVAGRVAQATGSAAATFDLGAGLMALCGIVLMAFWRFQDACDGPAVTAAQRP